MVPLGLGLKRPELLDYTHPKLRRSMFFETRVIKLLDNISDKEKNVAHCCVVFQCCVGRIILLEFQLLFLLLLLLSRPLCRVYKLT